MCIPQCEGKDCGPDGCGGSCGKCPDNWTCEYGECKSPCQPDCKDKECGPDGCGGTCGTCPDGLVCSESLGICGELSDGCTVSAVPGCGGCECEECVCSVDPYCCETAWDELCVDECAQCGGCGCTPQCTNPDGSKKECGPDGCGGVCGFCQEGQVCKKGKCVSQASKGCAQAVECVLSCGSITDLGCVQGCLEGLSPQSQQLLLQLASCLVQACGFQPSQQCIQSALVGSCQDEFQTCLEDTG